MDADRRSLTKARPALLRRYIACRLPEETSNPVSNAPAKVLAPVTAQELGGLPQAPARDDRPIVSRRHYALPEVDDRASSDPSPESVVPHKGRRADPPVVHPASGRERLTLSRSRRRRGDGAGRD
ncbi:hypothetical protein MRX96_046371 [Rhipicephalus microplus]